VTSPDNNRTHRAAIFYCNPEDSDRLRLDKEHRALDQVLERLNLASSTVIRRHAATIDDVTKTLSESGFEIVQFSGHGCKEGFWLEGDSGLGSLLSSDHLAKILQSACSEPRLIILNACYSTAALPDIVRCAPYVITIPDAVDDTAALVFSSIFYEEYFRRGSIETAFSSAQRLTSARGLELNAVLSRRAQSGTDNRVLFQVFPNAKADSIIIDLTEAEHDISRLQISRDAFLGILSKKIRIHGWLFGSPKEQAIIPLGTYFGVFSWTTVEDSVVCHRILRLRPDITADVVAAWAALIVTYNDHFVDRYRMMATRHVPSHHAVLKRAINSFHGTYKAFFAPDSARAKLLSELAPEQYVITRSMVAANLERCDEKCAQDDFDNTVLYLEMVLTSIHDYITAVADLITQ
jgi:hypothetical protein